MGKDIDRDQDGVAGARPEAGLPSIVIDVRRGIDSAGIEPEFLNKQAVATLLSVSPRTVSAMLARGDLPYVRLSRRCIRFPKHAVLDAMAARTIGVK